MRDQLIEILEGAGKMIQFPGTLANILIENGVTIQKWIPVSERLPEEYNFIAVTKLGVVGEAFIMQGEIYWQADAVEWDDVEPITAMVTHWMPLPEPPK